ncbi:MAG: hypothetical protein AB1458_08090 [Bacteroidota bacterium]
MKKLILTFAVFMATGLLMNFNSFAGCESALPNNLQACFNAVQQNQLDVNVVGNNLYITGTIDPSKREECEACINEYNAAAASCPGAPVIAYGNPPTTYGGTTLTPGTVQTKRG